MSHPDCGSMRKFEVTPVYPCASSSSYDPALLYDVSNFYPGAHEFSASSGKMLAPFRGRPMIAQVLEQFRTFDLHSQVVVLTSADRTDDPLADFVANRCGVPVFRRVGRCGCALSGGAQGISL